MHMATVDDTFLDDNNIGSDSDYVILQHKDYSDEDNISSDSDYVFLQHKDCDNRDNIGTDSDCHFLQRKDDSDNDKDNIVSNGDILRQKGEDNSDGVIRHLDSADTFLDDNNSGSNSNFSFPQKEDNFDGSKVTHHHSRYGYPRNNYKILCEFDICKSMEDEIAKVATVLSVSRHEASLLLLHFNWSVEKVTDHWIVDESLVRKKVGLVDRLVQVVETEKDDEFVSCGKCLETFPNEKLVSASCGHLFCRSCWSSYISTSMNDDGLGCLKLRCPGPSCHAAITQNVIESSVSEKDKKKLSEWFITSYIENEKVKWCPDPDCEYAIKFLGEDGMSFDVTCLCGNSFCWNCHEESHRPLDCETLRKWIEKTSSVLSKNMEFRNMYCKACPKCQRSIEKLGGYMQIRCCHCNHLFCWLCHKPHSYHEKCYGYMETHQDYKINVVDMLPCSLKKYTIYFERWYANRKSKLKALSDFKQVKSDEFERLSKMQGVPESSLDFITKAWLQIVNCRRVLEWSYAYGYFMPEEETEKKVFLNHLQGVAESTLEKLHDLMGKKLYRFINFTASSEAFRAYRKELVDLTDVTASYFDNLLRALENGLSDIASHDQASSSSNNSKNEAENGLSDIASHVQASSSSNNSENEAENYWVCDRCTFANLGTFTKCSMCVLPFDGYEPLDI